MWHTLVTWYTQLTTSRPYSIAAGHVIHTAHYIPAIFHCSWSRDTHSPLHPGHIPSQLVTWYIQPTTSQPYSIAAGHVIHTAHCIPAIFHRSWSNNTHSPLHPGHIPSQLVTWYTQPTASWPYSIAAGHVIHTAHYILAIFHRSWSRDTHSPLHPGHIPSQLVTWYTQSTTSWPYSIAAGHVIHTVHYILAIFHRSWSRDTHSPLHPGHIPSQLVTWYTQSTTSWPYSIAAYEKVLKVTMVSRLVRFEPQGVKSCQVLGHLPRVRRCTLVVGWDPHRSLGALNTQNECHTGHDA